MKKKLACDKRTVSGLREAVVQSKTLVHAALALLTAPGTVVRCELEAGYRPPTGERLCEGHARELAEAMQLGKGTILGLVLEHASNAKPADADTLLARWRRSFQRSGGK